MKTFKHIVDAKRKEGQRLKEQEAANGLSSAAGSVLHLTLKREWFDMIASGEKREEYREIKDYWIKRLSGKTYDFVHFRNGYSKGCPEMLVECKGIDVGYGKQRWGAGSAERFKIKLGRILSLNK